MELRQTWRSHLARHVAKARHGCSRERLEAGGAPLCLIPCAAHLRQLLLVLLLLLLLHHPGSDLLSLLQRHVGHLLHLRRVELLRLHGGQQGSPGPATSGLTCWAASAAQQVLHMY